MTFLFLNFFEKIIVYTLLLFSRYIRYPEIYQIQNPAGYPDIWPSIRCLAGYRIQYTAYAGHPANLIAGSSLVFND